MTVSRHVRPAAAPVPILGVGAVTAAGEGVDALWSAVMRAEPLAREVQRYDVSGLRTRRAALLDDGPDPLRACLLAAREALGHRHLDAHAALLLGTSLGGVAQWEPWHRARVLGREAPAPDCATHDDLAPLVARALGLRGPVITVSTACTSSALALITAASMIRAGEVREALVLGVDALGAFVHAGFDRLGALAPDGRAPAPFAEDREGLWLGEGCAALHLGEGVGLGRYLGGAASADGVHMTAPDRTGGGMRRAIEGALADANRGAGDVAWVSAHATCTRYNDAMEAAALREVFGDAPPPTHAAKPVLGHTLGACGALEAVICLRALSLRVRPPTLTRVRDRELAWLRLDDAPQVMDHGVALSLNAAMGGHNTALVLGGPA